jgi:hypothetical protein
MAKLFKKPKWIYTEINEPIYWVHIVLLAVWVYIWHALPINEVVEQYYVANPGATGFIALILWWSLGLAVGDTIAHSVLKMR